MSLITTSKANFAGFGSVSAKFATIENVEANEVVADDIKTGTLEATGDIVTTADVTCDTLNYTSLNPYPVAYTRVPTLATLVTQTIDEGYVVKCTDKAKLFVGLKNPEDTTILPSGTPWGADGFLTMRLRVDQFGTNDPTIFVFENELFVGTTVDVVPTSLVRMGTGSYELRFATILPYNGRVTSVLNGSEFIAEAYSGYARSGPPYSLITLRTRDYTGALADLAPSAPPRGVTITVQFVPNP